MGHIIAIYIVAIHIAKIHIVEAYYKGDRRETVKTHW